MTTTTTSTLRLSLIATLLAAAGAAQAHQIWIEQPAAANERAVVRFGEFGENLREASPGLLDKFGQVRAIRLDGKGEQPVDAVKGKDGYALPFRAESGVSLIAEDASYPLYSFKQGDKQVTNWYRPAARLVTGSAALAPKLTLDVVPAGQPGQFKVFFRGQPLAKAKVSLVTQSGWAKEAHSDEQGLVRFDLPWKGQYVAEVAHTDKTAGERQGPKGAEKYDGVNYVTSLTVLKADGVEPIAAGPAAAPNK
jgi:uncharacterized GH25 family protein